MATVFPDSFMTHEPSGDVCLFIRCAGPGATFKRLEVRRNRICFMSATEMGWLEWIVPVSVTDWMLGEMATASSPPPAPPLLVPQAAPELLHRGPALD